MASIRKKTWQTAEGQRECWVVEWRDQNGKLRSASRNSKEEADAKKRAVENPSRAQARYLIAGMNKERA